MSWKYIVNSRANFVNKLLTQVTSFHHDSYGKFHSLLLRELEFEAPFFHYYNYRTIKKKNIESPFLERTGWGLCNILAPLQKKKKKKKEEERLDFFFGDPPHAPPTPFTTTTHHTPLFPSLAGQSMCSFTLIFFFFFFSHKHTLLSHWYSSHSHLHHFCRQNLPENYIGKTKVHSSLLFEVKFLIFWWIYMLLLEVLFI